MGDVEIMAVVKRAMVNKLLRLSELRPLTEGEVGALKRNFSYLMKRLMDK